MSMEQRLKEIYGAMREDPIPVELNEEVDNYIRPFTVENLIDHEDAMNAIRAAYPVIARHVAQQTLATVKDTVRELKER